MRRRKSETRKSSGKRTRAARVERKPHGGSEHGRTASAGREDEMTQEQAAPSSEEQAEQATTMTRCNAFAFEFSGGILVHTDQWGVLADVAVLEGCFDLTRDAIDDLSALQNWYHPAFEAHGEFPDAIHINGTDYWVFADVAEWVINFRHVCAVRVVHADVFRALGIFEEWLENEQCPPWSWNTILGSPNSEGEKLVMRDEGADEEEESQEDN